MCTAQFLESMSGWVSLNDRLRVRDSVFSTAFFPADFRREFRWGSIPQAAVRPYGIVIPPPRFDNPPRLPQAHEPVLVQAFVAELPIKTLDEIT
jgi:hypothetical protein